MENKVIQTSKSAGIKDKRFYISDGIVLLSFSHPTLTRLIECKEVRGRKIEGYILKEKNKLLKLEHQALIKHERLRTLRNIICQNFLYYLSNSEKKKAYNTKVNIKSYHQIQKTTYQIHHGNDQIRL